MGAFEYLEKQKILSKKTADTFKSVAEYAATIYSAYGYYKAAVSALEFLGFLEAENNPIMDKLEEISKKIDMLFDYIEKYTEISTTLDTKKDLCIMWGRLKMSHEQFKHYLTDPNNEKYKTDTFFTVPLEIAQTLLMEGENPFWARVVGGVIENFDSPYTGPIKPMDIENGTTWEWRLPMADFLSSLSLRVTYVMATEHNYIQDKNYCEEFSNYARSLLNIYLKIVNEGIRVIRPPSRSQFISALCDGSDDWNAQVWGFCERIYGVVEVYSGYQVVEKNCVLPGYISIEGIKNKKLGTTDEQQLYQIIVRLFNKDYLEKIDALSSGKSIIDVVRNLLMPPHTIFDVSHKDISDSDIWNIIYEYGKYLCDLYITFRRKHMIRTLMLYKKLYDELGLPYLWQYMNQMRAFAGESPISEEILPDCLSDLYTFGDYNDNKDTFKGNMPFYWSLRNLESAVDRDYLENYGNSKNEFVSLRQFSELLDPTEYTSLRQLIEEPIFLENVADKMINFKKSPKVLRNL